MRKKQKKFKKGAASFYIVAFSTLVLMIIATSFAAIIISEVTRTSNDDLSQSAYDSAMAGVEDAKLAYYNYQNCMIQKENGKNLPGCDAIFAAWKNPDCDMVAKILGRVDGEGKPVVIDESNTGTIGNNMQQAYTCVTMTDVTPGYEATLSSSNMIRVVKAKFDGVQAKAVNKIVVSWFSDTDTADVRYSNVNASGSSVAFKAASVGAIAAPPTISVAMVQTSQKFKMDDFDTTRGDLTDRAMVYLVPTSSTSTSSDATHYTAYNGTDNNITAAQFAKSNNKLANNLPYTVHCEEGGDYLCSATIGLPNPVGGDRNDDTFIFAVALPYGKPSTSFLLEFLCGDSVCKTCAADDPDCEQVSSGDKVSLKGVQVKVDSTGRANDLYRRVSVTLDNRNDMSLSIMGPLELLESGGRDSLNKTEPVLTEHNF